MSTEPTYSLEELAKLSETSGRTIRYYITQNLLAGPVQSGRNACYTKEHLRRLREIKTLKQSGLTLHEIARQDPDELPALAAVSLKQFVLAPDVIVTVAADIAPWRMKLIKKQLAELAAILNQPVNQENNHDNE